MTAEQIADTFFADYASALLARDAAAIARLYAVPSLVLFPGSSLPVTSEAQTEQFFAGSMGQYDGVQDATPDVTVLASTGHSIWCDVTWSYDGTPQERFVYQLIQADGAWKIGVLTPFVE